MKLFSLSALLLGALSSVTAQTLDPTYIQAIIQALGAANLTSLAGAAQSVANTTQGATFLAQLAGSNKTLLAPNNDAFAAVDASVTSNATLVAEILSYHVLNVSLSPAQIANSTNHTIARSLYLSGGLPANRTSPVVLTKMPGTGNSSMIEALQLNSNATVLAGPVSAANFMIYVIDEVLSLPPSLTDVATAVVPSLAGLIQQANLLEALENTKGVTVFAPSDSAVAGVADALGTLNSTTVSQVLANHVIVGAAVYSTNLLSTNYTSAGGEAFRFMSNSTGVYVMSGMSTARIIRSDIITQNGVVHVIDGVLVNPAANPAAASSAASSYAVAATATTAGNGGGVIGSATSTAGSGTGAASSRAASSGAASSLTVGSVVPVFVSLGAIAAGIAAGAAML